MNDKDNLVRTALSLLGSRDKDDLMRAAFLLLSSRSIVPNWATLQKPYSALSDDCTRLMLDTVFVQELTAYLQTRQYIHRSVEMLLTHMAMAENSHWHQTPDWMQPVSKRGRYINRFIPTFLVINGPIGRFLRWKDSPVKSRLGEEYPILNAAHNFLDDKVFKALRNGFAHWSFDLEVSSSEPYLISYEDGKDVVAAKLHLLEAEAFHIIAFGLTEILDTVFFQGVQNVD